MKIRGTAIGLVLLLSVLAGVWTGGPVLSPTATAQTTWPVRGWLIVDFSRTDVRAEWRTLWDDANHRKEKERWMRSGCSYTGARPNAAILSISRTTYSGETLNTKQRWESFALIGAASRNDLVLVEQYVEFCYSHVDLYRIEEELR